MKTIIFSDMDGTLLDEHYSFKSTKPVIDQLLIAGTSIVLCSSKTRAEIEHYRTKAGIKDPFISENGAAIFIPKDYFPKSHTYTLSTEKFDIIEIGMPYLMLRQKLRAIKTKTHFDIVGFGDLTAEEIAQDSGLPFELAVLAKQREYDEPFLMREGSEKQLIEAARAEGVCAAKGDRYWHLKGNHDKGTATKLLIDLYIENFGSIRTVAVGNGPNDLPMLSVADKPFFVSPEERLDALWGKVIAWTFNLNHQNRNS
jgi:mannosyl-3-phosphoglycerate phosphatase